MCYQGWAWSWSVCQWAFTCIMWFGMKSFLWLPLHWLCGAGYPLFCSVSCWKRCELFFSRVVETVDDFILLVLVKKLRFLKGREGKFTQEKEIPFSWAAWSRQENEILKQFIFQMKFQIKFETVRFQAAPDPTGIQEWKRVSDLLCPVVCY